LRAQDSAAPLTPKDLKLPEWKLFSKPDPAKNSANLRLRVGTPPAKYAQWIESVVLIDRLREVQALAGFTRLEAGGDDSTAKLVPLRRGPAEWVPAAEVRGEGLFLQLSEAKVSAWVAGGRTLEAQFFGAHRRWRAQRGLEPSLGFPGLRYVLLHSLAHALIRQFSVACGYAAASLRERIYSSTPDDEELMAGNQGLMHAKCAIADRECLFLTSANLSGNAMAINMELGVCIHGGPLPEQVERHFDDLLARGDLQVFE